MRELASNGILDREPYQKLTDLFRLRSVFKAKGSGGQPCLAFRLD